MGRIRTSIGIALLGLALGGCLQPRPPANAACAYRALPLRVDSGHPQVMLGAVNAPSARNDFAAELARALASRPIPPRTGGVTTERLPAPPPPQFLVLSGGSQHGAFGAGFFYGMKQVPKYDVVTGISTGSLLSTFLFLANSPVPKDRSYNWVDGPLAATIKPGVSNTGDLALAYSIAKEGDIATPTSGGIIGGLSKGALATFGPLEARLKALLTPETLHELAQENAANRKLYVGVVNLDDGQGYAIDMTELASRIDTPTWTGKTDTLQDCYVQALVASSSVPPSAYPVSLAIAEGGATRTNMYMDGGARFGVFLQQLEEALGNTVAKDTQVTVIVNGVLYSSPWLDQGKPVEKWSSLTAGARAVSLLENQVYRFSVASAENYGIQHGGLSMAFISNEGLPPGSEDPDAHVFNGKSCAEWTAIDNLQKPLEFHPNYMSCLSDYGRTRGVAEAWNRRIVEAQAPAARR
ncbi:MAG: patatin-like phospholipase family protein [Sphingomonas sp.]